MDSIDIPRLEVEPLRECINCPICDLDMCGNDESTFGWGVCVFCTLNMERPPEGVRPWLGLRTYPRERLDRFWAEAEETAEALAALHVEWALPELDFEALEAAIDRMGT